jgi:hypothetical protein
MDTRSVASGLGKTLRLANERKVKRPSYREIEVSIIMKDAINNDVNSGDNHRKRR